MMSEKSPEVLRSDFIISVFDFSIQVSCPDPFMYILTCYRKEVKYVYYLQNHPLKIILAMDKKLMLAYQLFFIKCCALMFMINAAILKKVYMKRPANSHKGDFGYLLIIAGSRKFAGAPALVARAALRAGTDVVTIAAPRRVADTTVRKMPEIITYPLDGDFLKRKHARKIIELSKGKDACVIGPGLSREKETLKAVEMILKKIKLPCVIDADAIYAFKMKKVKGKRRLRNFVPRFLITPHSHEFKVLTGMKATKLAVKQFSSADNIILLKGNPDIISDGIRVEENWTGNPYMTKGGTGDALAGVCGSLVAQGNSLFDSACAGAYITGKAGDIVAKKRKQSLMTVEIIDAITDVIK